MFKRKTVLILMVISMLFANLVGCKPSTDSTKPKTETTKLVWYYPGSKQADHDMVQNELNKKLKEKINTEVVLQPVSFGEYNQKMNIIIAARDGYDICFTSDWLNNIYSGISKGAYMPLNNLIDKYAPNIKKSLPEKILKPATFNGELYAVPNYQVIYRQWAINIPKDLAQKYNFNVDAVPQKAGFNTLKAIEPYFESIKQNEPSLYPVLAGYTGLELTYEQIGNFAIRVKKDGVDNKVYNIYETDEWNKQNNLLSDWYSKGYIRKDIMSIMDEKPDQKNNKYASFFNTTKPGGLIELKGQYGREFYQILLDEPYLVFNAGLSTTTAISQSCKNPEQAIKLIELMNTDKDLYNMMCFGIEGVHYKKVSDTNIEPVKDTKYAPLTAWVFGNQLNAYLIPGQEQGIWDETHKNNMSAKESPIYGFALNTEPIKEKLSQVASLQKEYANLYVDKGTRVREFKDKLKLAGIEEIIKNVQEQVDAWAKKK